MFTWARDTVMCLVDNFFWQLSIDHNMDAQFHVKYKLYMPWAPC